MNHHARLCACAISISEEGPSTGTEPGSEAMLGFPVSELEENRLHSFKQERRGEEEREKKCLNVSVTEPTEEICKIGKEILFSLGDF